MRKPIPAPGFQRISGKRNPPASDGGYWVQLATDEQGVGWVDELGPWPASGINGKWRGEKPEPWEIVAVKKA